MIKLFLMIYARFIRCFGTHIVVGVGMGGKDVLYVRQQHHPMVQPISLLQVLNDKGSMRFTDSAENHCLASDHEVLCNDKEVSISNLY